MNLKSLVRKAFWAEVAALMLMTYCSLSTVLAGWGALQGFLPISGLYLAPLYYDLPVGLTGLVCLSIFGYQALARRRLRRILLIEGLVAVTLAVILLRPDVMARQRTLFLSGVAQRLYQEGTLNTIDAWRSASALELRARGVLGTQDTATNISNQLRGLFPAYPMHQSFNLCTGGGDCGMVAFTDSRVIWGIRFGCPDCEFGWKTETSHTITNDLRVFVGNVFDY
jgi:hypothetical protein